MSASNHDNEELPALIQHPDYYIEGADLSFLAERTQFKVHRYFFERESPYFRAQLEIPVSAGGAASKGSNSSNAIVLSGVKATEFELFLWVFYNPTYSLYKKTVVEWEVILRLAEKWTFLEVKNLAVRELEKLTILDVDRIAIYQAHNVDRNLLVPSYSRLCERAEHLNVPEGLRLGMETTISIANAREVARRPATCASGPKLEAIIRDLFDIKLEGGPARDNQASHNPEGHSKENRLKGVNGGARGEGNSGQHGHTKPDKK
ncbi:uncharacterized protein LACBIDRAFT_294547 [Laccaria bicolor S238N-H82]|uniref:Predicted protein n=1 Tax=Laccaria bicolor (strain S238N-H82 / ATCC MYA-4686) TaxID=486041 RepID=B0DDM8_LACBS|nr:uncharacterized protein LACBIDRAFT_294547 [Laccaria bicolor S238N-H82]EDR07242.1 predicted protein [Laccaria bicolor S238N-H82]|eukprot:XP_001882173.1 predicted protein [Laccaria bicolor S238N-H82]